MTEVEVFNLANLSRTFATRTRGKEAAQLVSEIIETSQPETIVIEWNGVVTASPSFIDEFVGGISEAMLRDSSNTNMVFTGDDPHLIYVVDAILRRRNFPVLHAATTADIESTALGKLGDPTGPAPVPA